MKFRISHLRFLTLCFILFFPIAAAADSSALILNGPAGSPEHAQKFAKWTETTRKLLVDNFGFAPDRVLVLADKQTARPQIEAAFAQLKQQLQPLDTFFLFFIGHGSFDTDYKFNISLADITAADYSKLISTLNVGRTIIINGTNSSGGAIPSLAGKNRVVVTATRSGGEGNDTLFYEYFLAALQNSASDEDKDTKVSVWEAFRYTVDSVDRFYKDAGRISTEHAQISDNGAPQTGVTSTEIPILARSAKFQVDRPVVVADARVQALLNERKAIEEKIEFVRINKPAAPSAEYDKQLEDLLVELALKNQQIREQEKK